MRMLITVTAEDGPDVMKIEIVYDCLVCALERASVDIDQQAFAGEFATSFMHRMQEQLAADHLRRSPSCQSQALSNITFPAVIGSMSLPATN